MRIVWVPEGPPLVPPSEPGSSSGGGGGVTVTCTLADLLGSSTLVAVMVTGVATVTAGAVNTPAAIVPAVADQVTAGLAAPDTVAVNVIWAPAASVPSLGDKETATGAAPVVES